VLRFSWGLAAMYAEEKDMIIKPIPGVGGGVNTPIYQPTYQLTAEN
jgi:hypothetical protein